MYQRDLDRLQKIRSGCKVCKGSGYHEESLTDGTIRIDDCPCVTRISREVQLLDANIPRKYRTWTMHKLTNKFVAHNATSISIIKKYMSNINSNIERGHGLWLVGPPGTAKSSIICSILKRAIKEKHNVYYSTAAHLTSLKFGEMGRDVDARAAIKHIIKNVSILAIEEIDKRDLGESKFTSGKSMASKLFFQLLADVYNENIPLLISSNSPYEDVIPTLPLWIQDRFKSLMFVVLRGASGREDVRNASS